MTVAKIGYGAIFKLHNGTILTALGEITAISIPASETAEVEATHFASPNRRREYISGLIEDGEGTFEMNLEPGSATDILIRAAQSAGDTRAYEITIPKPSGTWVISGSCIVRRYERNVPIDDKMTATMTVRFTGAVTEVAVP